MNHKHHWKAGHRVFGLHGATNGKCDCGNPKCQALYKHPRIKKWQLVPHWGDEVFKNMIESGQFASGYGVLCKGLLVVDIDPRNGGERQPDIEAQCGYIVKTGGGGWHYYFTIDEGVSLLGKLPAYKGIDFKSSGYVVGAGSDHALGKYEVISGSVDNITPAPESLIEMLMKQDHMRVMVDGLDTDITLIELEKYVMAIDGYDDYERWVQVGMAIHETTSGADDGLDLWDKWSRQSSKYNQLVMDSKWHSFGKSGNVVTFATLKMLSSYEGDVTFELPDGIDLPMIDPLDTSHIDLTKPPGFIGNVTEWINSCSLYPREYLAAAVAIQIVSAAIGKNIKDDLDDIIPNLMFFLVAGSGTGKESLLQAIYRVMHEIDLSRCLYGGIKSEQEIIRNVLEEPINIYAMDEVGGFLAKVVNAKKSGAHYLEALFHKLMELYSKSNGLLQVGGDVKREIKGVMVKELASSKKLIESGELEERQEEAMRVKVARIEKQLELIDSGIETPFTSVTGFTTPEIFDEIVNRETVTNGFFGRSIIVRELETNPRAKPRGMGKVDKSVPPWLTNSLLAMMVNEEGVMVSTTTDGIELTEQIKEYFYQLADDCKSRSGLEAVPRRGYELTMKVSLVLAADKGVRGVEEILWAFALVKEDALRKIALAVGNDNSSSKAELISNRIIAQLSKNHEERRSVLIQRVSKVKGVTKEDVEKMIEFMVTKGVISERNNNDARRPYQSYRLA